MPSLLERSTFRSSPSSAAFVVSGFPYLHPSFAQKPEIDVWRRLGRPLRSQHRSVGLGHKEPTNKLEWYRLTADLVSWSLRSRRESLPRRLPSIPFGGASINKARNLRLIVAEFPESRLLRLRPREWTLAGARSPCFPNNPDRLLGREVARATGLEPATSGVTGRHSNRLSYARAKPPKRCVAAV